MQHAPSGNLVVSIAIVLLLCWPIASAQQDNQSASERLVAHFDELPPGLEKNGKFHGARVVAVDDALGFAVIEAGNGKSFRAEAQKDSRVRLVETDPVRQALAFTPNDPQFSSKQYAPQLVGAPAAWSSSLGASRTVCVLDTGARYTHEDLKANYAGGIDLVNGDNNPWDDHGHGTRVTAAATATINNGLGVAGTSNARFLSVKVLDHAGYTHGSAIASGIRWCADNGANIVSMSFGGEGNDTATYESVMYAWSKGVLLVAGAGNGGCDDCVIYPAALERVIAVGCVDQSKAICSFTSRGSEVDLAAPGINIQTAAHTGDAYYTVGGGTSMSTPIVAASAALVWGAHPDWTNTAVRHALETNALDVGPAGRDTSTGSGLVRPDLAIGPVAAPPPTTSPSASSFSATVRIGSNINEWWIETFVESSNAIGSMETRINGGSWLPLPKTSWGAYAKSYHAPRGASVEFRVRDASGASVLTNPVSWMSGAQPTTASTTSSPSPTTTSTTSSSPPTTSSATASPTTTTSSGFSAKFQPRAQSNVWWVECAVSGSSSIAKVHARVNGGTWIELPKTDWGTYAKSIHAPSGSKVEFRATATTGATATSSVYTWG